MSNGVQKHGNYETPKQSSNYILLITLTHFSISQILSLCFYNSLDFEKYKNFAVCPAQWRNQSKRGHQTIWLLMHRRKWDFMVFVLPLGLIKQ